MKLFHRSIFLLSLFSILALGAPLFSYAQIGVESSPNDIVESVSPKYPKPNQDVSISLSSYVFNIDTSLITWSIRGTTIAQGIGKKDITVNSGSLDQPTIVTVTVAPGNKAPIQKQIPIIPSVVTFLWEAQTYTPPFYKGKALFSSQSPVTITAIAEVAGQGAALNPDNFVYTWKIGSNILSDQSGYGKKSVSIEGNYWGRDEQISVTMDLPNDAGLIEARTSLSPEPGQAIIYENNPLLGVLFNHAITGTFLLNQNDEATFFAAPYFLSKKYLTGSGTEYRWSMNGRVVSGSENGNSITFRDDTGSSGMARVRLEINQPSIVSSPNPANFSINFK